MAMTAASLTTSINSEAIGRIPRALAFRHDALALSLEDRVLTVAVPNVGDLDVIDQLQRATRLRIKPVFMSRAEIRERLAHAYSNDVSGQTLEERRSADAPAVRSVNAMFEHAICAHASDVHVEPRDGAGHIRLRIDGVLIEHEAISADLFPAFVSRIKLLSGMDIADKRQPQDGRFTLTFDQRQIDARVSSMPTIEGEKLVVRLLDMHSQICELRALGMPDALLKTYRQIVHRPWGFVVVTGPTGSGKTTTLYASLADLDATANNICSVEDPIEMRVRGVTQVGVNPRAGLTFASALRSFMRQDPNVIMVGEMRDAETAAVAISASLAGQLVFTTLHSNDAPRTIERLVELGVARQSLAAGLTAVLAQRLVRRLCEACRVPAGIPLPLRSQFDVQQDVWWVAGSCRSCSHTGYTGRLGVYELLAVDDALRDAIGSGASSVALGRLGASQGFRPMFLDGLDKVLSGATSFAELVRVVGPSLDR